MQLIKAFVLAVCIWTVMAGCFIFLPSYLIGEAAANDYAMVFYAISFFSGMISAQIAYTKVFYR